MTGAKDATGQASEDWQTVVSLKPRRGPVKDRYKSEEQQDDILLATDLMSVTVAVDLSSKTW